MKALRYLDNSYTSATCFLSHVADLVVFLYGASGLSKNDNRGDARAASEQLGWNDSVGKCRIAKPIAGNEEALHRDAARVPYHCLVHRPDNDSRRALACRSSVRCFAQFA